MTRIANQTGTSTHYVADVINDSITHRLIVDRTADNTQHLRLRTVTPAGNAGKVIAEHTAPKGSDLSQDQILAWVKANASTEG